MKTSKLKDNFLQPLITIFLGFLIGGVIIFLSGESVIDAYAALIKGAFGSRYFTFNTLARATPIILVGLGVSVAYKAGFFNLGAEGQMVLGAVSAALVALYFPGAPLIKTLMAIVVGMAVGGSYALLAAWMDVKFNINLLISTLLLNYIAVYIASYLVTSPFKDNTGSGALPQTEMIDKDVWLPKLIEGMSIHVGFIIAIVVALLLFLVYKYTVYGYKLRMFGLNSSFAIYGGINRSKIMLTSVLISGGLAGLAGTVEVLGMQYRYIDGTLVTSNYAWSGLMACLLAKANPLGTIVAAIFLAALQTGAMGMERNTSVPMDTALIIQSVLILLISAKFSLNYFKFRKEAVINGSNI